MKRRKFLAGMLMLSAAKLLRLPKAQSILAALERRFLQFKFIKVDAVPGWHFETEDRDVATEWAMRTLMKGYTLTRHDPISEGPQYMMDIKRVRERAAFARRPRIQANIDDEIPF